MNRFLHFKPSVYANIRFEYRLLRLFSLKIYHFRVVNRTFLKRIKICPLKPLFMEYFYCRWTKRWQNYSNVKNIYLELRVLSRYRYYQSNLT